MSELYTTPRLTALFSGVAGDCTIEGATGHIDLLSWGVGGRAPTQRAQGGFSAGTMDMGRVVIAAVLDGATSPCLQKMFKGEGFDTITINEYKLAGAVKPDPFGIITLTKVFIEEFSLSSGSAINYVLAFQKISISYKPQNADSSLGAAKTAAFDVYKLKQE